MTFLVNQSTTLIPTTEPMTNRITKKQQTYTNTQWPEFTSKNYAYIHAYDCAQS